MRTRLTAGEHWRGLRRRARRISTQVRRPVGSDREVSRRVDQTREKMRADDPRI